MVRASTELWDPATDTFVLVSPLSVPRAAHTATLLADGRVLVAGGDDPVTAEIWDPATLGFSATGSPIDGRAGPTTTLLADGRVLVVGDFSRKGIGTKTEIWDPAAQPVPSAAASTVSPPSTPGPLQSVSGG